VAVGQGNGLAALIVGGEAAHHAGGVSLAGAGPHVHGPTQSGGAVVALDVDTAALEHADSLTRRKGAGTGVEIVQRGLDLCRSNADKGRSSSGGVSLDHVFGAVVD